MSSVTRFQKVAILFLAIAAAGCRDDYASAQTRTNAQAQIRENLGDAPAHIDTTTAYRLSAAFRGAAERALPAVVRISVVTSETTVAQRQRSPLERILPFPFDDEGPQQRRGGRGIGSGFVFDSRGYIMTNNHVVENADRVLVTMVDGREYNATVVGSDPQTDVGVIKIEARNGEQLQPVEFGSSDNLHVGDWVIALGNPLNLQFTVTQGIVSAKGRNLGILNRDGNNGGVSSGLESFIQTDAVINPGNSGGPMVDLTGKVVGINSAIESATGYWAGNGFAIPIDLARKVADDIIKYGHVRRPRLGVTVGQITAADAEVYKLPSVAGAAITSVQAGEAADRAGIQMGDVVVAMDGKAIHSQTEFMEELARQQPGDRVRLGIVRYGQRLEKTVQLGEFESASQPRANRPARPRSQELLGLTVTELTPSLAQRLNVRSGSGVVITDVDELGSSFGTGLGPGTIIRKINGREVTSVGEFDRIISALRPGQVVSLVVKPPQNQDEIILNFRIR